MAQFGNRMFGGAVPGLLGGGQPTDMMHRGAVKLPPGFNAGNGSINPGWQTFPGGSTTVGNEFQTGVFGHSVPMPRPMPARPPGNIGNDLPIVGGAPAVMPPGFGGGGPTNYPGVSTPAVMPPSFGGGVIGYTPPPFSGTPDFSNSQPMPRPTPGNRPGMGWGAAGPRPMPPGGGQTNWKPPMGNGGMGAGMMPTRPGTAVRPPRMPINVPGTRGPMRSM